MLTIECCADTSCNMKTRVAVIVTQGQGVQSSTTVQGMVFKRQVEGDIMKAEDCKVAVYSCPLDIMQTETKVVSLTADILLSLHCCFYCS